MLRKLRRTFYEIQLEKLRTDIEILDIEVGVIQHGTERGLLRCFVRHVSGRKSEAIMKRQRKRAQLENRSRKISQKLQQVP